MKSDVRKRKVCKWVIIINSDMVVNTATEEIVFIGYIGEEVNLDYTKPGGSLFGGNKSPNGLAFY